MPRIIAVALIAASIASASAVNGPSINNQMNKKTSLSVISDDPAQFWYIWWTGAGKIGDFLVCNCMQGGIFSRAEADKHPYEGLAAFSSMELDQSEWGKTCEYPKGSGEYYIYSCGFWFGALYPTVAAETIWKPNVSKAAYYSDMGAMSVPEMFYAGSMNDQSYTGLYFSDMVIPKDYGYEGEGERLFANPGEIPASYQIRWPFADSTLNNKRPADQKISPDNGDIVSHEDTYAVGGDWIPDSLASVAWQLETGKYDGQGLGIRVEQRTYSWNSTALANALVLNYKVRNMNNFTLKAPYFSYFVDPDIGSEGEASGDDGCWDDLVDFDKTRGLGYAYDAGETEPGWSNAPGYLGVVLLDTPNDKGITGFKCWGNAPDNFVEDPGEDSAKYAYMSYSDFVGWGSPDDIRMLVNSGPYPDLAPNAVYDFTVAVVMGANLNELKANVDSVKKAFDKGFLPFSGIDNEPAPTPSLGFSIAGCVSDGSVKISYSLPATSHINIALFDVSGRRLSSLKEGPEQAGVHEMSLKTSKIPSGVYFLKLTSGTTSTTAKMVLVK